MCGMGRETLGDLGFEIGENEKADGAGEVRVARSVSVDRCDHGRDRRVALIGDHLEASPERALEAHAGVMAGEDNRALPDRALADDAVMAIAGCGLEHATLLWVTSW